MPTAGLLRVPIGTRESVHKAHARRLRHAQRRGDSPPHEARDRGPNVELPRERSSAERDSAPDRLREWAFPKAIRDQFARGEERSGSRSFTSGAAAAAVPPRPELLTATPAVLIAPSTAAAVCSLGRRCREGCAQSCDRPCLPLRRPSRCVQEIRGRWPPLARRTRAPEDE